MTTINHAGTLIASLDKRELQELAKEKSPAAKRKEIDAHILKVGIDEPNLNQ